MFHFSIKKYTILYPLINSYAHLLKIPESQISSETIVEYTTATTTYTEVPEPEGASEREPNTPLASQAVGPVTAPDNRERSDTYSNVALRINDRWRVIICPERIQWILQKRKGYLDGRPAWDGMSFCRSKAGLYRAIRGKKIGYVAPETETQMAQLPEWVES